MGVGRDKAGWSSRDARCFWWPGETLEYNVTAFKGCLKKSTRTIISTIPIFIIDA